MTEENQEINVDQLLAEVEAPSAPRAESAPEAAAETPAPEAAAPEWNGTDWEFDWNGKKVAPDSRDKAKTWMAQGYNYSQRMGELNKTHAQRLAEIEEIKQKYSGYDRYKAVDEYARQNPQWWEHVEKSFGTREKPQVDPSLEPVLNPILERLQQTESVLSQWQQEKQQQELQRQDQSLDTEIEEIRKSHPNIDLTSVDPASGETLELRVLKHANQIGTNSFKAAFRDYFYDQLIELEKSKALESVAKEKQAHAQKGILGRTPAPVKGIQPAQNHRNKSYDELVREGLAEFGAG